MIFKMNKKVNLSYLKKMLKEHGEIEFCMFDKNKADKLESSFQSPALLSLTATKAEHLTKEYLEGVYAEFAGNYAKSQYAFCVWVETE